ncbi:MAG: hypothetical protein ACRERE_40560 [Candidatus Entotheonellia bacterium]
MSTQMGSDIGCISWFQWLKGGGVTMLAVVFTMLAGGAQAVVAAAGYERQPVLQAGQLAPAELLQGPGFQVDNKVPTQGFLGRFTIRSDVGTFEAHGREMLRIRVAELGAIKQLEAVSKTETFAKALGSTAMRPVKAVGQIVTQPVETVKGLPKGVERLFGRVQLGAESLWSAATASDKSSEDRAEEVASRVGGISRDVLGYEQERRQLAKSLKVDPYTTNKVLAGTLDDIAWVTFSARLGINTVMAVFVPGSLAMSTTTFTTDLVWDTPTAELHRLNEQKLRDMGLGQEPVRALMKNPWYSLTVLTACVSALEQLSDASGRDAVVVFAASAASESQARFVAESLQMLAHYHRTTTPLTLLAASGPITARDRNGAVVVPAPVDYVAWTTRVAELTRHPDLKAQQRDIWLTGQLSPRARRELTTAGWTVHEQVQ